VVKSSTAHCEESILTTLVKTEYGERTKQMTRLNQLLQSYTSGNLNASDHYEFIDLLIEQGKLVNYYGEQVMELKAANALLNQQITIQKVN